MATGSLVSEMGAGLLVSESAVVSPISELSEMSMASFNDSVNQKSSKFRSLIFFIAFLDIWQQKNELLSSKKLEKSIDISRKF